MKNCTEKEFFLGQNQKSDIYCKRVESLGMNYDEPSDGCEKESIPV